MVSVISQTGLLFFFFRHSDTRKSSPEAALACTHPLKIEGRGQSVGSSAHQFSQNYPLLFDNFQPLHGHVP